MIFICEILYIALEINKMEGLRTRQKINKRRVATSKFEPPYFCMHVAYDLVIFIFIYAKDFVHVFNKSQPTSPDSMMLDEN